MADLAGDTIKNLLTSIIHEATADMRAEISEIRSDVKVIKTVQGQHGVMLRTTQSDVNSLKTGYRKQARELTRLGGLFEDFEHRFQAASELG